MLTLVSLELPLIVIRRFFGSVSSLFRLRERTSLRSLWSSCSFRCIASYWDLRSLFAHAGASSRCCCWLLRSVRWSCGSGELSAIIGRRRFLRDRLASSCVLSLSDCCSSSLPPKTSWNSLNTESMLRRLYLRRPLEDIVASCGHNRKYELNRIVVKQAINTVRPNRMGARTTMVMYSSSSLLYSISRQKSA